MYTVEYRPQVVEIDIPQLPKTMRLRIAKAIEQRLAKHPEIGKPLQYKLAGYRRLRVGDYRIIYGIDVKKKIITITAIDHRKDVYET